MGKTFDFNTRKKEYLTTTLPDEAKTTIMVGMPTKKLFGELTALKTTLNTDNNADETIDELYDVIAKVMSNNKGGIKITRKKLESCGIEFDDLVAYFNTYIQFVRSFANVKN